MCPLLYCQDLLAAADSTKFEEKTVEGRVYYDFEIDSSIGHALISVTSAKNKLYAHFVNAPPADWSRSVTSVKASVILVLVQLSSDLLGHNALRSSTLKA